MKLQTLIQAHAAVIAIAVLAGCTAPAPEAGPGAVQQAPAEQAASPGQRTAPATPGSGGEFGAPAEASRGGHAHGRTTMHNVSVEADFITPGTEGPYAGWDGPSCDPAQEGVCQWAGHETMYPTDDVLFRGTFLDETVVRPDTEDGFFAGGTWTFTGSIVGCNGEGNVVFPWTGAADEDPTTTITPDTSGRVLHGHDLLWSPTNMTGLVVSAAFIDAEYYANPIDVSITRGHLSGYIVCEWDGAPAPGTQQP